MLEQVPDLDAIIVSAGGGGLCTGIATYAKSLKPEIKGTGIHYNIVHHQNHTTKLWSEIIKLAW